ncbi:MAG: MGMT family protein [Atribacterota bacterium]
MLSKFQKQVYSTVKKIPRGKAMSYKQVARAIGKPRAYRAVGNALNRNKDLQIPCHRVICSNGSIGGYNKGSQKKIKLLIKEGVKL